jgi:hypothetical protein
MADRVMTGPDHRATASKQTAYYTLVILGGQALVPLLLALFLINRSFNRHPTLLVYLLSWVCFSISACLLLYTGHTESHPPYNLCLAQVALINAAYIMIAFAAVSLMLQLRFTLPTVNTNPKPSRLRDAILVAVPPVASGLYMILFYAARAVEDDLVAVERGRFTCRFQEGPKRRFFAKFTPILLGLLLSICLAVSMFLLHRTVRRLVSVRGWELKDTLKSRFNDGVPWLRILSRFVIFGIYSVLTMVACLITAITPQGPFHEFVDFYVATLPLAAASIFGTVPDLREMWRQWRTSRTASMDSDVTMVNEHYELNGYAIPRRPPLRPSLSVPRNGSKFGSNLELPMQRKQNVGAGSFDSFDRGKSILEDDILVIA